MRTNANSTIACARELHARRLSDVVEGNLLAELIHLPLRRIPNRAFGEITPPSNRSRSNPEHWYFPVSACKAARFSGNGYARSAELSSCFAPLANSCYFTRKSSATASLTAKMMPQVFIFNAFYVST